MSEEKWTTRSAVVRACKIAKQKHVAVSLPSLIVCAQDIWLPTLLNLISLSTLAWSQQNIFNLVYHSL